MIMHGAHKPIDDARLEAYSMRLEDIDVSRPELFRSQYDLAVFRAAAERSAGPLLSAEPRRLLLVGDQI